jgi:hypothetical protein
MRFRMRSPDAIASRSRANRRARRSRLAIEITIALAVKFVLIYAIWNAWFSDPVSRKMTKATIAADMFGPVTPQPKPGANGDGSRP